jgi:hypothetical protein
MLITLAVTAVVLIAVLLGLAAAKSGTFRVHRSRSIQAPPEKIYPLIDDFHNWTAWSPYEKLDPNLKKTYSGSTNGKGAVYAWVGNSKAGEGRMEIIDTAPSSRVTIKLDFLKPFEGHNTAEFTLQPKGDSTDVTWAVHGPQPYFVKVMTTFFSMDRLMGKEFDAGLDNMKAIAERR